ncbi:hypothetical protein [Nesterenkonia aurantiaca]|uniref:PknH-like protein n=1 Tax=Nesterenkonia aurantiaca TaxID=1436010 RepID=A0A4R7G7G8_9MICC|nr:hypothetical protein [Nesterenkonia aurantiaca]TDS87553.1 hypothetical protein EV640_101339 [Nesterenkonia aurantiaca]
MSGLRSTARRAAPSATRTAGLLGMIAAATLSATACSSDSEDLGQAQDAAGLSAVSAESAETAGQSSADQDAGDPEGGSAEEATESGPEELLTQREIAQILLTESELPFTPDSHSTLTGLDFFQDQLGATAEVYTESFGEGECTSAMDRINADLIGDSPERGVVQEYQHELADRTESLYVWMLGLEDRPNSSAVWDRVVEACTGQPLQAETDSVDFEAFEAHDFRGLELEMEVYDGESMVEVLGFSASKDYGRHLLMVSAANMDAETFEEIVESQAEKLATFDHELTD